MSDLFRMRNFTTKVETIIVSIVAAASITLSLSSIASAGPLTMPVKKGAPKTHQQVENIPVPPPVQRPAFTEAAFTLSTVSPQGKSMELGSNTYDLSQVGTLPVISAQIQHWMMHDFENNQTFGFILGTGLSDKRMDIDFTDGTSVSKVDIVYLNLLAGLSWEQLLLEDQMSVGLSGVLSQELWEQNATSIASQWSRWVPAIGLIIHAKCRLGERWYGVAELHNRWPFSDKQQIDSTNQRFHFGLGYSL